MPSLNLTSCRYLCLVIALTLTACVTTEPIQISGEGDFPVMRLAKEPGPTVLIAHGCGGWRGGHHVFWAEDIRHEGYNALLLNSFEPRGFKEVCNRGELVHPSIRAKDIDSAARWVKAQKWHRGKVAVIGFSHGGSTALHIANNSEIKNVDAVISFYPGCGVQGGRDFVGISMSNPIRPAQVHLGSKDDWTPPSRCISSGFKPDRYETYFYPNAGHGFDEYRHAPIRVANGSWLSFDKEATIQAKKRVFDFLNKNLKD
jgi:dienelactone hydrolase